MRFFGLRGSSASTIEIDLSGSATNPCVPFAPDIDYIGTITIDPTSKTVSFVGFVDEFPAFEMFVSIDGRPAKSIFLRSPELGSNPWNLYGAANVPVFGIARFD
jgi:hypothetical protein